MVWIYYIDHSFEWVGKKKFYVCVHQVTLAFECSRNNLGGGGKEIMLKTFWQASEWIEFYAQYILSCDLVSGKFMCNPSHRDAWRLAVSHRCWPDPNVTPQVLPSSLPSHPSRLADMSPHRKETARECKLHTSDDNPRSILWS